MIRAKMAFSPVLLLCQATSVIAQKIVYSEPEKDDTRRMNFEIVGKIGAIFLFIKISSNQNWISVLDNDMKQIAKVEQDYVPDNDRMINVDFFPYTIFVI